MVDGSNDADRALRQLRHRPHTDPEAGRPARLSLPTGMVLLSKQPGRAPCRRRPAPLRTLPRRAATTPPHAEPRSASYGASIRLVRSLDHVNGHLSGPVHAARSVRRRVARSVVTAMGMGLDEGGEFPVGAGVAAIQRTAWGSGQPGSEVGQVGRGGGVAA